MNQKATVFLAVLQQHLPSDSFAEVKPFWEQNFSHKPQFGMSEFLSKLYAMYPDVISIKKSQLFRELSRAIMESSGQINQQDSPTTKPRKDEPGYLFGNAAIVYRELYETFVQGFSEEQRAHLQLLQEHEIERQTASLCFKGRQTLTNWIVKKEVAGDWGTVSTYSAKALFSIAYNHYCIAVGPIQADRRLSSILTLANVSPEAIDCNPAMFLA